MAFQDLGRSIQIYKAQTILSILASLLVVSFIRLMSLQPGTYNIINAKSGTALDLNDSEIDPSISTSL